MQVSRAVFNELKRKGFLSDHYNYKELFRDDISDIEYNYVYTVPGCQIRKKKSSDVLESLKINVTCLQLEILLKRDSHAGFFL